MRIAITGHQTLRGSRGWGWIEGELRRIVTGCSPPWIGLSSLAVGADQRFAEIVLQLGGAIEVIVPFPGYETRFAAEEERAAYRRLLAAAQAVKVLPRVSENDEELYFIAGRRVVDESDLLIAVWDGRPAAGLGGTADVVAYAGRQGIKVVQVNPVDGLVTESPRGA
ncbi:MAG TPA: hypothetical protein VF173_26545 [Thermoanaerobaculia bacterium]|nr:hypothetical protein [Thermoanaerobaculia bacterium]